MRLQFFSARSAMLSTAATAGVALVAMNLPAAATSKSAIHRDNTGSYSDSVSGGAVLSAVNADGSNPFNDYGIEGKVSNDTGGVGLLGYGQQAKSYGAYGVTFGTNGIGVYGAGDGPAPSSGATPSSTQQSTGVVGNSASGDGVFGSTQFPNGSDVVKSPVAGVMGVDTTTNGTDNNGVYGLTTNGGFGVAGISSGNSTKTATGGVLGEGTTGYGVVGSSTSTYGVYGQGLGTATANVGIYGVSAASDGIYGITNGAENFYGVIGIGGPNGNGAGGAASSNAAFGLVGNNSSSTYSASGGGVLAESTATSALVASTSSTDGYAGDFTNTSTAGTGVNVVAKNIGMNVETSASDTNAIQIEVPSGSDSDAIYAYNSGGTLIFAVDGNGDVSYGGTIGANARTRNGFMAKSYSSRESAPSIGDVGSGQIVNGTGLVRLDPALVEQMDRSTAYHVFITPDGDTRGLYVASKTAAGFVVKETQGGRGTLAFDYRIVAAVDGQAGTRMTLSRAAFKAPRIEATHRTLPRLSMAITPDARTSALNAKIARIAHETVVPGQLFRPAANAAVESRVR